MRPRAISITAAAALVVVGLSGCTFTATQANQKPYDPSDGFGTSVGDVQVRNAILVTEDGEDANLVVNFINQGNQNVNLVASWENGDGVRVSRDVSIRAGATQSFGEGSRIVLHQLDTQIGSLFPVYFQYGTEEGVSLEVPVLDATLQEYRDLAPSPDQ